MPLKTTDIIYRKGKSVRVTRIKAKRGVFQRGIQKHSTKAIGSQTKKRELWRCRRCDKPFNILHALLAHARARHVETKPSLKRRKQPARRWDPNKSQAWYGAQFDKYVIPPARVCVMDGGTTTWSGIIRKLSSKEVEQLVDQVNRGGRAFCKVCADKTPALPGEELCQFHQAK